MIQDLKSSLRLLARSPGFSAAAICTLALGIGANAAVFSVVRGVVLRPLPYPDPDRLIAIRSDKPSEGWIGTTSSPPNYLDWRSRNRVFDEMAAYDGTRLALTGAGPARRLEAAEVTADFFDVLGTRPMLGRTFLPSEESAGAPSVVVLSHKLFVECFGGDRENWNRVVLLDGVPHTVIGVMPPNFEFPLRSGEAWVPLRFPADVATQRGAHYLRVIGRLRPEVALPGAEREMKQIAASLEKDYPEKNKGWTVSLKPMTEQIVGNVRSALWILLGAVSLLTLTACANVAHLMLARAAGRRSEMAIRVALGASRARLIRQVFAESLCIAFLGAGLGVVLAAAGVRPLLALAARTIPRVGEVRVDGLVLLFAASLAVTTAVLFGLIPAWHAAKKSIWEPMRRQSGTIAGAQQGSTRWLVAGEVALALTLLTGSSLLVRSFAKLRSVSPGFETAGVWKFDVGLPASRYPTPEQQSSFYQRLTHSLSAIPGVDSVGATMMLPLSGMGFSSSFRVAGQTVSPEDEPSAQLRVVSRGYFRSLSIPLRRGRLFETSDAASSPRVVLVAEKAARRYWPATDPIGREVSFGASPGAVRLGGRIIGVVGDVREYALSEEPPPEFYVSLEQTPVDEVSVVLRTNLPPDRIAPAVRETVRQIDPGVPVADFGSLEQVLESSVSQPRLYAFLLATFGGLSLLLSAIGVYGLVAYGVAHRTRELGLRIALGAGKRGILMSAVGPTLRGAGMGIVLGLLLSAAGGRLLGGLLFGVGSADPAAWGAAATVLLLAAAVAAYLPARRALRTDPATALKAE